MFTWYFWKHALERAAKTLAQVGLGILAGTTVVEWDVRSVALVLLVPTLASILTSIISARSNRGGTGDPSLV